MLNLCGPAYTALLFDADSVHSGMINDIGAARHVIQFKLAHQDDRWRLQHLDGMHVSKVGTCDSLKTSRVTDRIFVE